jgi:hypothetical protein
MRAKDQRGPFIRSLEERPGTRHYLTAQDPEDGRRYLWEAVDDGGAQIAVKQLEIDLEGRRWHYDWKHLEDDNGFLTDQPLYVDKNILKTTRNAFFEEWEG